LGSRPHISIQQRQQHNDPPHSIELLYDSHPGYRGTIHVSPHLSHRYHERNDTRQRPTCPVCSLPSDESTSNTFQFSVDRPSITVPESRLIFPPEHPPAGNPASAIADDGTELCYLGVLPTERPVILLGDTFVRSADLVFDADDLVIGMAR
jgi:hypothetical protein